MARMNQVGTTKTSIRTENGTTKVKYHATDVVSFNSRRIHLDTGGWKTNTTKTRMNQAANQFDLGYYVFQHKHEWFVDFMGKTLPFEGDTITLER